MPGPEDELSGVAKAYQAAAPWLNATSKLTGGVVVGAIAGYWFDKVRDTGAHWGLMVGSMVGIGAGFYGFISTVMRLSKK